MDVRLEAYDKACAAGDVDAIVAAATGLVTGQFGTLPGRVPAFLHEAYERCSGTQRARVGVALARCWAYGGEPQRSQALAEEAIRIADDAGDPELLASALDAQLLAHWGPDDLAQRLRIGQRLEDVAAHIAELEPRLATHLWRLTVAIECLDLPVLLRQLRALDLLAEETQSPRARFFARSRRGMAALLAGDPGAALSACKEAVAAGTAAGERDVNAIERELTAQAARQAGDVDALIREAELFESFGMREGITAIAATGALLWAEAGHMDRAELLLHELAGPGLAAVPRDVYWMPTMTALTEVAAAVGSTAVLEDAIGLLGPYAGRGVVTTGGVLFGGVVDDYLHRAYRVLGRDEAAERSRLATENAYRRMGARWWLNRVLSGRGTAGSPRLVLRFHPVGKGIWCVGADGTPAMVAASKGLQYLRFLLQRPGSAVSALELSSAISGHPGASVPDGDFGPTLDHRALAAYRSRLAELDEELEEARSWNDDARAERLELERGALRSELSSALGLAGRPRREGEMAERARVAVRKAIAATIRRIREADPAMARLLDGAITTGRFCRYDPDPGRSVQWILDAPSGTPR